MRLSVEPESGTSDMIVLEAGEKGTNEAMWFLSAGKHKLVVHSEGTGQIQSLVIRSIPKLLLHELIFGPPLGELAVSTETFRVKYVMSNVNTFVIAASTQTPSGN